MFIYEYGFVLGMDDLNVLINALAGLREAPKERTIEELYHDLQDICDDQAKEIAQLKEDLKFWISKPET